MGLRHNVQGDRSRDEHHTDDDAHLWWLLGLSVLKEAFEPQ